MADALFNQKRYLPKCWLARIDKYWYPTLPTDYPETNSTFDFVTGDDKAAVIDMEKNLNTEDSIISADDIPEKEGLGSYLGTYDVNGEPGEQTLISPKKLPDNAIGALAYHYDSENDSWNKIDTVEVIDGYVYATLDEFSPIAVFALKKAAYYDTSKSMIPKNVYVCNGVSTKIYKNDEDKIVAESDGVITELTESDCVVGGSYDGSDIEYTNVYVDGVKLDTVYGGSFTFGDSGIENKNYTKNIKLTVTNSEIGLVAGTGVWNCADNVDITVTNTNITRGAGCQVSYYNNHSSNKTLADSDRGLGSNQWVKKSNITIKDSYCYVMYSAGCNGYSTTLDATMYAENCKFVYACNGQSNGTVYKTNTTLINCEIEFLNQNNRGHWGDGKLTFKGGNVIKNGFLFCDCTEPDPNMADIRGKVSYDVSATDTFDAFCVGAISNVEVTTAEEAAKYIDSIKISRNAKITYTRNADIILKDIIRIK